MAGRRDRQVPSVGERREQGDRLSVLRRDVGLSQSQLGARVGWTAHDVSNLEAGVRSVATLRLGTAVRFADAFKDVSFCQHQLNRRPRKVLNYETPYEVFFEKPLHLV